MKDPLLTPSQFASLELQEAMASQQQIAKLLGLDSAREALLHAHRLSEPFDAVRKQAEEMRRHLGLMESNLVAESATHRAFVEATENLARFRRPDVEEITRLVTEAMQAPGAAWAREQQERNRQFHELFESVRAPFLQIREMSASVSALAELQGIGWVLKQAEPFKTHWADALRVPLGDWRTPIDWSRWDLTDPGQRRKLYAERGFDRELTDFPEPAFIEILEHTGITPESALTVDLVSPLDIPDADTPVGPVLMRQAYAWLYGLERELRAFVERVMTAKFGATWMRQRVPPDVLENSARRRAEAQRATETAHAPIEYFDFGDYAKIVGRKDNWREVFGDVFGRLESVVESLQRLHPVRNSVMHSRPLTHDDLLLLVVEVRRLSKAIRRHSS